MRISDLTAGMDILTSQGDMTIDVSDICYDSGRCTGGSLFVAVPGLRYDGHDFIDDAVRRGAVCVVHERDRAPLQGVTSIRVRDCRRAMGWLGKRFFGNPSGELCLIGITGTNGKTTVSYLLESILGEAGHATGVIGTINYRYGGQVLPALNTTPESVDLHRVLRDMADAGVTHVVMEVSSHAIDLNRVDDCDFDMGIFTNLTSEHLDYHGSMENYFAVKRRFIEELIPPGKQVINGDDPWGMRIIETVGSQAVVFSLERTADVSVAASSLSMQGIWAGIRGSGAAFDVASSMIGRFNLANILTAATAALSLGISGGHIADGIEKVRTIPGRLERVTGPGEPVVFVDYAHTEDALKRALENLAAFREGKIITVFGCGGDRDRTKRAPMGRVATELSDIAIITSDNPRTEDPLAIIDDIMAGITDGAVERYDARRLYENRNGRGYTVMPDRREAIELALSMAVPSDIVLIAGKGHEDYQILGSRRVSFDDRVVTREALARRKAEEGEP